MEFVSSLGHLRQPLWLLIALVPPVLALLAYLTTKRSGRGYADPALSDWALMPNACKTGYRAWQLSLVQLTWFALAVAMSGPRLPVKSYVSQQQYENDIIVVVDLSLSMSARDIGPSRIERTKLELLDLVEHLDRTRMGLVVYAAHPHLLTPPTADKNALRYYIKLLRTRLLPSEGSDLFAAVQFGINQFPQLSSRDSRKLTRSLLLVSDGETSLPAEQIRRELDKLAGSLKQQGILLYTLGIGSPAGSPLLSDQKGWLEFDNRPVVSKLNAEFLKKLANIGNGQYASVQEDDSDWITLYAHGFGKPVTQTGKGSSAEHIQWIEYYQGYAIAAVVFFLLAFIRPAWPPAYRKISSKSLTGLWLLLLLPIILTTPQIARADSESNYQLGYSSFVKGEYQTAREAFARVEGYAGRFAEASMAYHLKQYQQAIPVFIQATLDAENDKQRSDAIFNLANCYFKLQDYGQAARLYRDVLRYRPEFASAHVNLQLAITLKKQVKNNERIVAQRQGQGPRSADAPKSMDVTTGKLSLGDNESQTESTHNVRQNGQQPRLAEQTLEHSAPASEKIELRKDQSWTYDINSLAQLKQINPKIHTDESIIWQRLFEFEEHYEAAQETPNIIPGVRPW